MKEDYAHRFIPVILNVAGEEKKFSVRPISKEWKKDITPPPIFNSYYELDEWMLSNYAD